MTGGKSKHPLDPFLTKRWTDPVASASALESFASPFVGIAPRQYSLTHSADELPSHYVAVSAASGAETVGGTVNPTNGGGAFARKAARAAGIGETIERYCATHVDPTLLRVGRAVDFPNAEARPESYSLYSKAQYASEGFPFVPFTSTQEIAWVEAFDLHAADTSLVPAQLVFLNQVNSEEPKIGISTSNGLACGPSFTEALISGLFESAERDAFMITWHATLSMPRIDLSSSTRVREIEKKRFMPTGMEYHAVDLSSINGIPTALGVVRSNLSSAPLLGVGAASRATLEEASIEALIEAFHTTQYSRSLLRTLGPLPNTRDPRLAVISLEDHVRFYSVPEHIRFADFLTSSGEVTDLKQASSLPAKSPQELLIAMLAKLSQLEIDCFAVDVTTPEVKEHGFSVAKTIAPQFIPLSVGWVERAVGGSRIYSTPHRLGHSTEPISERHLNQAPHPFP